MKLIWQALRLFALLSLITGVVYPLAMTALGRGMFREMVEGQIISRNGVIVGSKIIAQKFTAEKYFWGRPSSTDYNPLPSGGSNLGPTSEALKKAVLERAVFIRKAHDLQPNDSIPEDLLFASGSGLDPEISPVAAEFQSARIAKNRGLDVEQVRSLIRTHVVGPDLGFLGEPRVNVMQLNLALDEGKP